MSGIRKDRTPAECPYCGGNCHRKAIQKLKSEAKPYRRMYCADGCGHFHYRDVDTDEIVKVGQGPRVAKFERDALNVAPAPLPAFLLPSDPLDTIAKELDIDPTTLMFTAKGSSGRPRAIVNALSDEDIERFENKEQDTIRK